MSAWRLQPQVDYDEKNRNPLLILEKVSYRLMMAVLKGLHAENKGSCVLKPNLVQSKIAAFTMTQKQKLIVKLSVEKCTV